MLTNTTLMERYAGSQGSRFVVGVPGWTESFAGPSKLRDDVCGENLLCIGFEIPTANAHYRNVERLAGAADGAAKELTLCAMNQGMRGKDLGKKRQRSSGGE